MKQIAKELSKLNATMAEILYLIQKEMKRGEELAKKYDLERKITNRSDYGTNSKRVVKTKCHNGRDIISHPKRNEEERRVIQKMG